MPVPIGSQVCVRALGVQDLQQGAHGAPGRVGRIHLVRLRQRDLEFDKDAWLVRHAAVVWILCVEG